MLSFASTSFASVNFAPVSSDVLKWVRTSMESLFAPVASASGKDWQPPVPFAQCCQYYQWSSEKPFQRPCLRL
ncbi:MAG: hypothetical protein GFH27_549311n17 [Chloroflexi bacterium AL-W]|nr:hypothetical protein [Chloroflexi bacterium AL-N1]NOK68805.1 hypothetical protein [Chloroflexi bacterium AL-N10]NOK76291.1 hypothetical protein [Chloroflexi bacterium AL-N5]NOK84072.1 hypothetical protein [Chloroflexi bacterium AL-W]NOK91429.1 hypothetical protein [Chloroflexi bacterium AL-N15]